MKALKSLPLYAICIWSAFVFVGTSSHANPAGVSCDALFKTKLTDSERESLEQATRTTVLQQSTKYGMDLTPEQISLVSALMTAEKLGAFNIKLLLINGKDYWPSSMNVIIGENGIIKVQGTRDYVNYDENTEFEINLSEIDLIKYSYNDQSGDKWTNHIVNNGNNNNSPANRENNSNQIADHAYTSPSNMDVQLTQSQELARVFQSKFNLGVQVFNTWYDISLRGGTIKTAKITELLYLDGRPAMKIVAPIDGPMKYEFWDPRNFEVKVVFLDNVSAIRMPVKR